MFYDLWQILRIKKFLGLVVIQWKFKSFYHLFQIFEIRYSLIIKICFDFQYTSTEFFLINLPYEKILVKFQIAKIHNNKI